MSLAREIKNIGNVLNHLTEPHMEAVEMAASFILAGYTDRDEIVDFLDNSGYGRNKEVAEIALSIVSPDDYGILMVACCNHFNITIEEFEDSPYDISIMALGPDSCFMEMYTV